MSLPEVADWVAVFERGKLVERDRQQIFDNPPDRADARRFLRISGWHG